MTIEKTALTFDDVLLKPNYSDVLPRETNLSTRLTKNLSIQIPLLSAAMDTVTEYQLAIAIAQEGGIVIIHKNFSVDDQASQVNRVKKFESGIISDPVTVSSDITIREVLEITKFNNISGVPVVDDGITVGIVTNRDLRFGTGRIQIVELIHQWVSLFVAENRTSFQRISETSTESNDRNLDVRWRSLASNRNLSPNIVVGHV